ncbi:molybdopterin-dependent oxidoreductase [Microbacterium sp. JB110]|uniref:molybdopterin-dependent oxidoreductase n=1 Tax=Microbacterium sp. JB110 TaxID=2024477 RepID=UPI00097EE09A|nr:molybdopterin-dependent oxidoreductase [Microbacterium sp. JB110]RCS60181.1 Asp-tRNA(Asn)/Glu-tRNA(Gln) amidotransferase GatCAB subunit C [Microbacterium sp. JB110]SJM48089.1 Trimethylamine-N-oxide reductase (Cytochrome c) [Frigoribacterium sp. JB110]
MADIGVIHSSHWGAFRARVDDGRFVEAVPFEADGRPADLLENMPGAVHADNRVLRPAVRRGWLEGRSRDEAPRGDDEFVEVDWDTAIDLVAREITRVHDEHGPASVYGGSYGWSSAGRFHHAQSQLKRLLAASGGYTGSTGTYSHGASSVILPRVIGYDANVADSHTWDEIAENTETWLMLGGVPARSMKVESGGMGAHRGVPGFEKVLRSGVRAISVNPIRGESPGGDAVEWLPIRPGTDTALLIGLAHTLLEEGRTDLAFLDAHTVGFDRFAAYLRGETDGTEKTADWASAITGVPADDIRTLARDLAGTRTLITATWSLQRAEHGEQPHWLTVVLAAMLGGIGRPGEGFGIGFGSEDGVGSTRQPFAVPQAPKLRNPLAGTEIPVARIVDALESPGAEYDFNGERRTYPDIRLIYWAGGNPFHHHQDLMRMQAAWQRPDTVIVQEPWWTSTAKRADIVLPATTSLERDDIGAKSNDTWILAMKRAIDPVGEALDDREILHRIATRLGCADAFDEGATLRSVYEKSRADAAGHGIELPDFDAFWEQGYARVPARAPHSRMRELIDGVPVPTPSGKIEIFSETIDSFGYDDCLGHPAWFDKHEDVAGAAYPLRLISHQPTTRLHSQMDVGALSRAAKVAGREACRMNPDDAAARGIADGEVIRLFNDRGACLAGVVITADVMPGVVALPTGAWLDLDGESGLERHGNPNVLTADRGTSKLAQGPTAQTARVEVERYAAEPPRVEAFDLPRLSPR